MVIPPSLPLEGMGCLEFQVRARVANVRCIWESLLMHDTQKRIDEVLEDLELERLRFDTSLGRLTAAAACLRSLLPSRRRRGRRCTLHNKSLGSPRRPCRS